MSYLQERRRREHARRLARMWAGSAGGRTGLASPVGPLRQRGVGTAVPRRDLLDWSVDTRQIVDGAVQAPQLADWAVTAPKIADGAVTAPKVPAGELTARELADGAVTLPKFMQGTRPVQLVDSLPDLPDDDFPPGATVVNLADGKVYRHAAPDDVWGETWLDGWPGTEGWTAAVDTFDLRGLIQEGQIGEGAVTADTIAANAVGARELAAIYVEVDKWIRSWNWAPGSSGWAIDGDGNAEFNDATFRGNIVASSVTSGQLVSANYQAGVSGWALDANGNAELNDATFRGNIRASSVSSGQLVSSNYQAGSQGWALDANGNVELNDGTFRGNIVGATITGATFRTAASGRRLQISDADEISYFDSQGRRVGEISWLVNGNFLIWAGGEAQANLLLRGNSVGLQPEFGPAFVNGDRIITETQIYVGNSSVSPSATTPRTLIDPTAPRILSVAANVASAVFGRNSNGDIVNFRGSGSTIGGIARSGSNVQYNTSSDRRLKTNIVDVDRPASLARIRALKPREFVWKADGTHARGLIADEVAAVIPEAATISDDDDFPSQVAYGSPALIADLIGAVQELADRVEAVGGA